MLVNSLVVISSKWMISVPLISWNLLFSIIEEMSFLLYSKHALVLDTDFVSQHILDGSYWLVLVLSLHGDFHLS